VIGRKETGNEELASAALFEPLLVRIRTFIDRRFYRSKYDAARTLEAFAATLHSELDLAQLSQRLVAVVEETMHPTSMSLWLRVPEVPARRDSGNAARFLSPDAQHDEEVLV
jgi:hypothetical protein